MIRYHRSLNHKLCRQGIGGVSLRLHQHLMRNHKFLGSGGSMVARLKLKEIDGRAPPGVSLRLNLTTRENLPGPDIVRIDRLRALS